MNDRPDKILHLSYYALLREERGLAGETLKSSARTVGELYAELQARHHFRLPVSLLKAAVNDAFVAWEAPLHDGDHIVFLPPVSGGSQLPSL